MSDKIQKGKEAEDWAVEFLISKGYAIVERNYRFKHAEIDIITKKDNWLIFVEVKMRSTTKFGFPETFVDYHQTQSILFAAENYTYKTQWEGNVRYDIISILVANNLHEIYHIEDAFY